MTASLPIPRRIIARKRDRQVLTSAEIQAFVDGTGTKRPWEKAQIGAMLMAMLLRGLNAEETVALTAAMRDSGKVLTWPELERPVVDKHSTGGVGDKLSLVIAPVAAACGLAVPMISGRGLGHTGGTLDKLESIPGFNAKLSNEAFTKIIRDVGVFISGQTDELAPADRTLYATRDATGTVASVPLITASVLSKKLSAGLEALVLDVKCGHGAFMEDLTSAKELARELTRVGNALGVKTSALITNMDAPLGRTVGNAVEVREALDVLRGEGPNDVRDLSLALTAEMLVATGIASSSVAALNTVTKALDRGHAAEVFARMVAAQGGHAGLLQTPDAILPQAPVASPILWLEDPGYVHALHSRSVGEAAIDLGAGRAKAEEGVDHAVGFSHLVQIGEKIETGQEIGVVHARDAQAAKQAAQAVLAALTVKPKAPVDKTLIYETIGA